MTEQLSMLSEPERPRESAPEHHGSKTVASHWSARHKRAITSYCRNHNAAPQLSTYPIASATWPAHWVRLLAFSAASSIAAEANSRVRKSCHLGELVG